MVLTGELTYSKSYVTVKCQLLVCKEMHVDFKFGKYYV